MIKKTNILLICSAAAFAITLGISLYLYQSQAQVPVNADASPHARLGFVQLYREEPEAYGVPLTEWSVRWWQWIGNMSIDENVNPAGDNSSTGIYMQPDNPVYFLTGGYNTAVNRTVVIPANKSIMFPVLNTQEYFIKNDTKPTAAEEAILRAEAIKDTDSTTYLGAELDGKPLPYYRLTSGLYNQTFAENNLFKAPVGTYYTIADGYWVFIEKPLPAGNYTIHLKGTEPEYKTEVTYLVRIF